MLSRSLDYFWTAGNTLANLTTVMMTDDF